MIYGFLTENENTYVIPPVGQPAVFIGGRFLWAVDETDNTFSRYLTSGAYRVKKTSEHIEIMFEQPYEVKKYSGFPNCDLLGNFFHITVDGSSQFEAALSRFYWNCMLNQCAERSVMRRKKRLREGYVLSTLQTDFYGGTYPAVDHEFHIRGRLAMGDAFDLQVVRRMLELQLHMMRTDWRRQFRGLVSLQPSGRRQYRVYRRSMDKKTRAVMFPLTANLEIVEELYHYYCLTKDIRFLKTNIAAVEKGLNFVLKHLDENGRLWADVYYEDQVMKDGANAQAQAFAIHAFSLMSKLETLLHNQPAAKMYQAVSEKMKANYTKKIPAGYWDEEKGRYIDWVDRQGNMHDHVHLLSNALPVTYDFHSGDRNRQIHAMIETYDSVFQKFPSFVAAKIEDYTKSEIGSGGPYDLCAAGRYWCHDAKYRHKCGEALLLKKQLDTVCAQAELDCFYMGERYDMNYIYYNTGEDRTRNWHGSPSYYEYPNVFADVLIHDFLGIRPSETADLLIVPCCTDKTHVLMESYGIEYSFTQNSFILTNISKEKRVFEIELSKIISTVAVKNKQFSLAPGQTLFFDKNGLQKK